MRPTSGDFKNRHARAGEQGAGATGYSISRMSRHPGLPPQCFRKVKAKAAMQGLKIKDLVTSALTEYLMRWLAEKLERIYRIG